MARDAPVLSQGSEKVVLPRVLNGEGACGEEYVRLIAELNDIRKYYERGVQESTDREGRAEAQLATVLNAIVGEARPPRQLEYALDWIAAMQAWQVRAAELRAAQTLGLIGLGAKLRTDERIEETVSDEKAVAPAEEAGP